MYRSARHQVRVNDSFSDDYLVKVGLYQDSVVYVYSARTIIYGIEIKVTTRIGLS